MVDVPIEELIKWCEQEADRYSGKLGYLSAEIYEVQRYRACAEALRKLQTIRDKWAEIEEHHLIGQLKIPTGLAVKFADFMDTINPPEQTEEGK